MKSNQIRIARGIGKISLLIGVMATTASAVAGPTLMLGGGKVEAVFGQDDREPVRWQAFPWAVKLLDSDRRHICTGFVTNKKIISAGHCSMQNGEWRFSRPRFAQTYTGELFAIVKHSVPCDYDGDMHWQTNRGWTYPDYSQISDDVAVLTTRRDITSVTGSVPISYSKSAHDEVEEVLLVAFHGDRPGGLMAQRCKVRFTDSAFLSDLAATDCDSHAGSSGAAIVLVDEHGDLTVAAVHVASNDGESLGAYLGAHEGVERWLRRELEAEVTASSTTPASPTGHVDLDEILNGLRRARNGMLL